MAVALVLKLVLAPALIGLASWATRHWGPGAGGWFAALPITSGPVVLVLALEQGPAFAKQACVGVLLAVISLAAFAAAYAWSARRWRWGVSSVVGCVAYLMCTWRLRLVSVSLGWTVCGVCAALAIAVHVMPGDPRARRRSPLPEPGIALRMLLTGIAVYALTSAARAAGPRLSGLLAPFPVVATILAAFTHHAQGAAAVGHLLRSLLIGLYSFSVFFLLVSLTIVRWSITAAFVGATAGALIVHAVIWCRVRDPLLPGLDCTRVLDE